MKLGLSLLLRGAALAALASTFVLAAGCGEDAAPEYTLALSVDRVTLTADGSDFATVRVTVLDQRGYPPPIGSEVLLQAQNGGVQGSSQETGTGLTDATGTAQFTITCRGESPIQVLSLYKGATGFLLERITCQPAPRGDWQVLVSASSRSVNPNGTVTITADAVDGQGAPVPQGTALTFQINEPNPGARFRTGAGSLQILTTPDTTGRINNVVIAPGTEDEFTVCVSFTDQRFGRGQRCITIRVGTSEFDGAVCLASYAPARVPADGVSTSVLTFTVFDDENQVVGGATIEAEIALGEFLEDSGDPNSGVDAIDLTTDATGLAEVTILSPPRTGTADVSAFADYAGLAEPLACDFSESLIFFPPPTCEFDPIGTLDLGDTRSVRACFKDFDQPVPAGRRVDFELVSSVGGTTLTATTAFTDSGGCALTGIASGRVPGGLTIRATMPFGVTQAECQSDATIQRGGVGSANQMTLSCQYRNLGVYLNRRGTDIPNACTAVCQANVADQFNNPVEGSEVYFTTEAGSITSVATTNAAGVATAIFYPRGFAPLDVPPTGDEPVGTGVGLDTTLNPRDSLVTIVASTVGQEMFNDADGDGQYDDGEYFIDLPEPFVDANDDDVYTPGGSHETFTDVAVPGRGLNGVFDGPNGQWDAYTQIWATTWIVYSGAQFDPAAFRWFPNNSGSGIAMPPAITSPGRIRFTPIDQYGNGLSSGTTFGATTTCERALIEVRPSPGDGYGVLDVGRVLKNFQDGREVGEDAETPDFGRFSTSITYGTVVAPHVDILISVDEGLAEECSLTVSWAMQGSVECADGATPDSRTFRVTLPPF